LPNGNTLITEGSDGRLFEVTREHKTVWEYVSPFFKNKRSNGLYYGGNSVYRAYRTPYEWIPDLEIPAEKSVKAKNISRFRVPGAPLGSGGKITLVEGVEPSDSKVLDDPLRGVVFPRALESSVSSDIDTHGQEQGCFKHGTA
jgi:hypothetical protein